MSSCRATNAKAQMVVCPACAAIVSICEALDATDGHGDLFDMYAATAAQVLRRDWRTHPVDAARVAECEVGS